MRDTELSKNYLINSLTHLRKHDLIDYENKHYVEWGRSDKIIFS